MVTDNIIISTAPSLGIGVVSLYSKYYLITSPFNSAMGLPGNFLETMISKTIPKFAYRRILGKNAICYLKELFKYLGLGAISLTVLNNCITINNNFINIIFSAIISIMICCLATLGYNYKLSKEKEKIEVDATSNFNQN